MQREAEVFFDPVGGKPMHNPTTDAPLFREEQ
jgi:hypothetical protein